MAISIYPKANPLWGNFSTITVNTFKSYSAHTFDYPYPKAVSVSAEDQGMEYDLLEFLVVLKKRDLRAELKTE
jgi:hypothetical protein